MAQSPSLVPYMDTHLNDMVGLCAIYKILKPLKPALLSYDVIHMMDIEIGAHPCFLLHGTPLASQAGPSRSIHTQRPVGTRQASRRWLGQHQGAAPDEQLMGSVPAPSNEPSRLVNVGR